MKKIIFISVLCLLVSFVQAQKPYSVENLQNLSQEELDVYYNNALKLQKTGKTMTIIGICVVGGAGVFKILGPNDLSTGVLAGMLGIAGIGVLGVVIPMNLTGKARLERIHSIKNTAFNDVGIKIQPCVQYNLATQNYQPAVTLLIRF